MLFYLGSVQLVVSSIEHSLDSMHSLQELVALLASATQTAEVGQLHRILVRVAVVPAMEIVFEVVTDLRHLQRASLPAISQRRSKKPSSSIASPSPRATAMRSLPV